MYVPTVVVSTVPTPTTVGTYTLTFDHTDTNGNVATQVTRTVHIVDTTAPVITLVGSGSITQEAGTTYTDAGATYTDNIDPSGSVTAIGTVNTNIV